MEMTIRERIRDYLRKAMQKDYLTITNNETYLEGFVSDIYSKWNESHRHWHNLKHLEDVLDFLEATRTLSISIIPTEEDFYKLIVAAIYHDVIYDPRAIDNEEQSVNLFCKHFVQNEFAETVSFLIMSTKEQKPKETPLAQIMFNADWKVLIRGNPSMLMKYEDAIFKEFQFVPYPEYKRERINFLSRALSTLGVNESNIQFLINYVQNRRPKIGIYAGSFNPFTIGHKDIADKADKIFDKVIIVRAINPSKSSYGLVRPDSEQLPDWHRRIPYEVVIWSHLLTEFIEQVESYADVTYIRGLRNSYDLQYEWNQLQFIKELKPDINHMMIFCDADKAHISSSDIRALMVFDSERVKKFIV